MFVYLATLVYDLFSLILPVLLKQHIPGSLILRQLVWIANAFVIIRNQPIGFTVFVPLTHSVLKVLNNMLTVMETASKELNPDAKWSQRLDLLSFLLHVFMVGHQVYFHSQASCMSWVSSVTIAVTVVQTLSMLASLRQTERKSSKFFNSLILG